MYNNKRVAVLTVMEERAIELEARLDEHKRRHKNDVHLFDYCRLSPTNITGSYAFYLVHLDDKYEQLELQDYCDFLNGFM